MKTKIGKFVKNFWVFVFLQNIQNVLYNILNMCYKKNEKLPQLSGIFDGL